MRNCVGVFVAAACLAGCASGPTANEALTSGVKSNVARLVIYRTSPLGFAVQPRYVVDGRVVGGSQAAGFLACDLAPGPHEVAVSNLPLSGNPFEHGREKMTVNLRAGSTVYISAEPQVGIVVGGITLIQVTEDEGRADVANRRQSPGACDKA